MTQNQQHVSNQKTKIVGSTGRLARPYYTKCDSEFQMWLYDHSTPLHKCNICATYFDCTTYYYDISKSDINDHDEDENVLKKISKVWSRKESQKRHDYRYGSVDRCRRDSLILWIVSWQWIRKKQHTSDHQKTRLNQQFGDLILFKQWNKLTKSIKYHNFDAEYIVQTVESPFWWLSFRLKQNRRQKASGALCLFWWKSMGLMMKHSENMIE